MLWRDERVRFGAGIVGVVVVLASAAVVLVFGLGTLKWLVRDSAPTLMGWPGGSWIVGSEFGLVTVFGCLGGLLLAPGFSVPGAAGVRRGFRIAGSGDVRLWAPVLCLLEAERERPGIVGHVGVLIDVVHVIDDDYAMAVTIAGLCRDGVSLGVAAAVHAARPNQMVPEGALVATVAPEPYEGLGVGVMDLNR